MLNLKNRSIAATGAAIATLMTVAAAAPARAEMVSVPVSYADLDLSTPSGAQTLQRRISRAASTICGAADPMSRLAVAQCRSSVKATAQADVRLAQQGQRGITLAAK